MFGPEFQVVDTDPTFSRVMRYMRTSDLGLWAGATAAFPALMYAWGTLRFFCYKVRNEVCMGDMVAACMIREGMWGVGRRNATENDGTAFGD